jgi:hypothetical protein
MRRWLALATAGVALTFAAVPLIGYCTGGDEGGWFDFPGATPELRAACEKFLLAATTDDADKSYGTALKPLAALQATPDASAQLRARCLYLQALGDYLENKPDNAAGAAKECAEIIGKEQDFPDQAKSSALAAAAREQKLSSASALLALAGEDEELAGALLKIESSREKALSLRERCWDRYRPRLRERIESLTKKLGLPAASAARFGEKLEPLFRPKSFYLPQEVDDLVVREAMEELFRP